MGLYVRKDQQRSKLQERIAADLQQKAKAKQQIDTPPPMDGVEDSNYMTGTKTSSSLLGVWLLLLAIVVGGVVLFIVLSS